MKKIIIGTMLSAAAVASTFAQGNVLFSNGTATKESINSSVGGVASATTPANAATIATTYYYALFFSTTATTVLGSSAAEMATSSTSLGSYAFQDSNWTLGQTALGTAYAMNSTAGKFASSVVGTDGVTTSLNNANVGSADYFTIVGWSANIGSTITSVQNFLAGNDGGVTSGYLGESDVSGLITTGITGSTSTVGIFGAGAGFVNPFVIGQITVPEPSTIALGVMGAASLLALRRKKA